MDCKKTGNSNNYHSHVIRIGENHKLSKSDDVLLESVLEWYNEDKKRVDHFLSVVKRRNGMSLRVVDWLVTNFSKTHSVMIDCGGMTRDLNREYQRNLSAYNKRNLDPFARKNKITVLLYGQEKRSTTVGQLNFFRWFFKSDIGSILDKYKDVVKAHMESCENKEKKIKKYNVASTKSYTGRFVMVF